MGRKILLVGCGSWGKLCARDLLALDVDLFVIARSQNSINNAKSLGISQILPSIEKAPEEFHGAVVATPLDTHYTVIKQLLNKFPKIQIFSEKELTASETEALELDLNYSEQISIMHKWCYHTGIQELKKLIGRQDLGKLIGLTLERHGWGNTHDTVSPIWTLLPHDLSIVHELLGYIPEVRAAVMDKPREFIHGINIIAGEKPWVRISASDHQPQRERTMLLHFEKGLAYLPDAMADTITIKFYPGDSFSGGGAIEEIKFQPNMPLFDELAQFVEFLSGDAPKPKNPVSVSIEIIKAINQAIKLAS
jgi:predicted dehydrogenase